MIYLGEIGEVNEKFLSILSKNSSSQLENEKDVLRGVPLLDFLVIRLLLSGQTM